MDVGMKRVMERYCPAVDDAIARYFDRKAVSGETPFIRGNVPLLREYCLRPGKRIRPMLVLAAYEGYAGVPASQGETDIAAAAEIMHAAFLVHDDIIDRAETRRGLPTLDRVLQQRLSSAAGSPAGHDCGIVFGDILIYAAMELVASAAVSAETKVSVMNETLDIYRRTAWGQALDIVSSKPSSIRAEDEAPAAVSEMKTAWYTIAGPLRTGLRLSGRFSDDEAAKLSDAALPLGVAFQLRDDLLGVFGDEQYIGKSPDSDLAEGKYTLLVQKAALSMNERDRVRFMELFPSASPSREEVAEMRTLIEKSGAKDHCIGEVAELVASARGRIGALSIKGPGKDFLCGLCSLVADISGVEGVKRK